MRRSKTSAPKATTWPSDQTQSRVWKLSFTHKICFSVYIHTLRGNHPTVRWSNCSFPWGLISRPHFWQSGQVTKAKSAHQWTWARGAGVQLSQETPTELYRHPDVTVSGYDCLWGSEAETPNLCVLKIKLQYVSLCSHDYNYWKLNVPNDKQLLDATQVLWVDRAPRLAWAASLCALCSSQITEW